MSDDEVIDINKERKARSDKANDFEAVDAVREALEALESGEIPADARCYVAFAWFDKGGMAALDGEAHAAYFCAGTKNRLETQGLLWEHLIDMAEDR